MSDLRFDLEFEFNNLKMLKDELKKAKEQLDQLTIGTDAFAKKEKQVFVLNQRIQQLTSLTKKQIAEQQRLTKAQEDETGLCKSILARWKKRTARSLMEKPRYSSNAKRVCNKCKLFLSYKWGLVTVG